MDDDNGRQAREADSKLLLLVDGSSYLYRAFHALPDLRNAAGEPTGAIYGVLNMLRRLHKDYQADYSACVFDAKGKTFRDDMYDQYKAHRPPMPNDLASQVEPLCEAIRSMGWPLLIVDGVEADDVIGTLTRMAREQGIRSVVSTGDKDMAQLVDPWVTLVNTMSNEKLDVAGVQAKFGVLPERIVDYLALIGDSVDNIPGVDKCGPKTAVKWLAQYGTLDEVRARAGEIGGVVGENLRRVVDWLPRARELLTIRCDVPLGVTLPDLALRPQDTRHLTELLDRFGFRTWKREIEGGEVAAAATPAVEVPKAPAIQTEYECIVTMEALDRWMARLEAAELVAFDSETDGLEPMQSRLVGISFAVEPHRAAYVPLHHRYAGAPPQLDEAAVLTRMRPWLEDASRAKVGQNLKFDKHILANHGLKLCGISHDTLLQSYVLESHRPHDLGDLAARHCGLKTVSYDEVTGKGAKRICFSQVSLETATGYAAEDADVTLQVHRCLSPQVEADPALNRVYRDIEMPLLDVLFIMERNGVLLDSALLAAQSREMGLKILELEQEAHRIAGQPFNLSSPKQIQEILFQQLKLPVKKRTPGGTPSTDEDVLQALALDYPLPKVLLEHRGLCKLKSTYTDKLPRMVDPRTGRVHTCFSQATAITGRLASSEPNLQNIPVRTGEGRRIREAFVAPAGSHIVSADYSQIELRIMAHLSGDARLKEAFANDEDIHRATAAEVFGVPPDEVSPEQRRYAKVINFGLIYGMSHWGLASQLGIERTAAQSYMDRYFARYPGVADYMQRTREAARTAGYVETVFGRRLWLPEIRSSNAARRQGAERAAINAPMQGTAADLVKLAMIAVQRWIEKAGLATLLVLQVHDELVLEVPEAELEAVRRELPGLMCGVAELEVPLAVDVGVGPNWEQAH